MQRQEQAARTRAALIDAAAAVFDDDGFRAARIQDILDRASVTKGAMYHHFETKLEVAQALAASAEIAWRGLIADATHNVRGIAAVQALWQAVASALHDRPELRASLRIANEIDTPRAESPFAVLEQALIGVLQQAIADGEVSERIDTHLTSVALIDTVCGVVMSPAPWAREDDVGERLRRMWVLMAPGLVAR